MISEYMETLFLIVITALSALAAGFIPDAAYRYACYKSEKRATPQPLYLITNRHKLACVLVCAVFTAVSALYEPAWKAVFAAVFVWTALFGAFVDSMIRIIGNEMLAALFLAGVIYRFLCGGFQAVFTGIVAMIGILVLFVVSALILKLLSGSGGVGMGDVKLAMTAAFIAGKENMLLFLIGMSAAMVIYVGIRLYSHTLTLRSSFPMCLPLMMGLLLSVSGEVADLLSIPIP